MSSSDKTRQSAIRTFFTATARWFENYSKSSMSASEALAMRDAILSQQWEKSSKKDERTPERTS